MIDAPPALDPPGPNGFQELFTAAGGQPINYQGHQLIMVDRFSVGQINKLGVSIESTNSIYRQGVRLDPNANIKIDGRVFRTVALWEDTAPTISVIEVPPDVTALGVRNVWEDEHGTVHSWYFGAAMILSMLPNGRRYFCNDGQPDADFDDIVFRIERLA